jgi:hypothetical protein
MTPHSHGRVPHSHGRVPHSHGRVPHSHGRVPHSHGRVPGSVTESAPALARHDRFSSYRAADSDLKAFFPATPSP